MYQACLLEDIQAISVEPVINRFSKTLDQLLANIGSATSRVSAAIPEKRKVQYSQYFTPLAIAKQMAAMLDLPAGGHLGDAGAGAGILGAAALALHYDDKQPVNGSAQLRAFEIDETLHAPFLDNLGLVSAFATERGHPCPEVQLDRDYLDIAVHLRNLFGEESETLDAIILNPPYKKLGANTEIAQLLKSWGVSVPNLYAVFMVIALEMLKPGGEMVAIVPRSFANGDYFKSFRAWIRTHASIEGLVRYRSRSNLFRNENVLHS